MEQGVLKRYNGAFIRFPAGLTGLQRTQSAFLRRKGCPHSDFGVLTTAIGRQRKPCRGQVKVCSRLSVDNRELLIGDCILLVAFCLYKQITSIILSPTFPGWLAPLHLNLSRFGELASFATTLTVSWVLCSLLVGGYRIRATSDLRTALQQASKTWLISMPVAACQLVLLTAAEDKVLVGSDLFASALPLAASGPGEPIATAAGVLGIMAFWRCFYTAFLDFHNFRNWGETGARKIDRVQDMMLFKETLRTVFLLCIVGIIIMQYLGAVVGEESIENFAASLHLLRSF